MANYVNGVRVFSPHAKAPDFVLAELVLTPADIASWMAENSYLCSHYNGKDQVKMTIKKGRDGKVYAEVNTYGTGEQKKKESSESETLPF